MHLYAFGSVCRGEVTLGSDIDLLAVTDGFDSRFDVNIYSVYSYGRLRDMWVEGAPFAWHLSLESKLIYSSDGDDYLKMLGRPARYNSALTDCAKFAALFKRASASLSQGTNSRVFELSTIFLAVRNFATCFSLGAGDSPDFSRYSALRLGPHSLRIDQDAFDTIERARILSTRGVGKSINKTDECVVISQLDYIAAWMERLTRAVEQ
ncbi:nucleotidyltransferase domain-containing protein [Xanthomonas indica]|uniref:Nucleotidyltransferase domain-containing protein n=1 Tax=Xanthomonas indica TaxID=2912242 RepID=A0AAU8I2K2_9XANT|nr:nucleotidyltransferase domain-containing protein [Xanthomonas indica]MCI2260918.1 nucleotidyltransferase domain-containing protein [Xanthomonas indica]